MCNLMPLHGDYSTLKLHLEKMRFSDEKIMPVVWMGEKLALLYCHGQELNQQSHCPYSLVPCWQY